MVITPEGLSHWSTHFVHRWPNWLTLCFFTCVKIGREKANQTCLFILSPAMHVPWKKKCSWPLKLLFSPSDIPVSSPFPQSLPDCPEKQQPFCKWCFSQEEVFPDDLITLYPGSSFLSHSQTDPCCCDVYAADVVQHYWNVSEVVIPIPASKEECQMWWLLFWICIKKIKPKMLVLHFR